MQPRDRKRVACRGHEVGVQRCSEISLIFFASITTQISWLSMPPILPFMHRSLH